MKFSTSDAKFRGMSQITSEIREKIKDQRSKIKQSQIGESRRPGLRTHLHRGRHAGEGGESDNVREVDGDTLVRLGLYSLTGDQLQQAHVKKGALAHRNLTKTEVGLSIHYPLNALPYLISTH